MTWYDEQNNFLGGDDNIALTEMNRLRLAVAAEFMRCKVYGKGGIDSALDDADTALGFLTREGHIIIPSAIPGVKAPKVEPLNADLHNASPDCRCDYCKDLKAAVDIIRQVPGLELKKKPLYRSCVSCGDPCYGSNTSCGSSGCLNRPA